MRRILKTILVILLVIIATPGIQNSANVPIRIVIDQELLVLDQTPILEDGRVLLPLRDVFEALGAQVDWDPKTQGIIGKKDNRIVNFKIGENQASVNNEQVSMDVPGNIINGKTMVPIRFIAESLGIDIEWNAQKQMVVITTMDINEITVTQDIKVTPSKSNNIIYKSTNFQDNYMQIKVSDNDSFEISGKTVSENRYVLIEITDIKGNEIFNNQSKIKTDGTFKQEYAANLADGKYIVNVFMHGEEYGTYHGTDTDIVMHKSKDGLVFETSTIYENNKQHLSRNNAVSLSDLNMDSLSKKNENRLIDLARRIVNDQDTDYYKTLAIANWVSQNIYYDLDVLETGKFGKTDAIGTLDERRSVCQGYAALTTGLLRSIGIPAKLVFGYSLVEVNSESSDWNQVDHTRPNHVWNEVFVDNRWIIVDTTWNSKNIYEKGKYTDGQNVYTYFDPTIEAFSRTHKITNR